MTWLMLIAADVDNASPAIDATAIIVAALAAATGWGGNVLMARGKTADTASWLVKELRAEAAAARTKAETARADAEASRASAAAARATTTEALRRATEAEQQATECAARIQLLEAQIRTLREQGRGETPHPPRRDG